MIFLQLFSTLTVTSQNAFQITFGDGILPCMSRDFGKKHAKTPRGILPSE